MSISSVTSTTVQNPPKATPVESAEVARRGKEIKNDGDSEDAGATTQASAPKPVTNLQGQALGQTVNVTA